MPPLPKTGPNGRRTVGRWMLTVGVAGTALVLVWATGAGPYPPAPDVKEHALKWVVTATVLLAGVGGALLWSSTDQGADRNGNNRTGP
ncbi:hypothetical protein ACFW4X_27690 [Streptomyces smyrnaeus]